VVIKGTSCAGARRLAVHLTRTDTNERAEVRELSGVAAEDLRGALLEMEAVAAGTRSTKPFYHASINTRADEKLTDEQRAYAIDRLEEKLGLSGQARVIVLHQKEGREHCHIVWSRIDLERMRAISDSHNYRKHEEIARDLERHFGHERVQGAHAERDGKPRPDRTPSHSEMLQAERGAATPDEAKALITAAWKGTDSGQSFKAALENQNWLLARGDRRDFVVIDPNGGTHSLARRVDGAKAKDIRARMADIDTALLPSVSEARDRQRERQQPVRPIEAIQTDHVMADADASRAAALKQLQKAARADTQMLQNSPLGQVSPERAFGDAARTQAQEVRNEHRDERLRAQQEAWRVSVNEQKPPTLGSVGAKPVEQGLQVVDRASGTVTRLADFILDFLSGTPAPAPEKREDMKAFVSDPAARKQQQLARLAATRQAEVAEKALEQIREDIQAGRNLKSEDIKNLTRQHQEQIRAFGDSAVHQMVDEARKRSESYWKGNERER
jgi:hypothetical protein